MGLSGSWYHGYPTQRLHVQLPFPTHIRNKPNKSQVHNNFDMCLRSSGKLVASEFLICESNNRLLASANGNIPVFVKERGLKQNRCKYSPISHLVQGHRPVPYISSTCKTAWCMLTSQTTILPLQIRKSATKWKRQVSARLHGSSPLISLHTFMCSA